MLVYCHSGMKSSNNISKSATQKTHKPVCPWPIIAGIVILMFHDDSIHLVTFNIDGLGISFKK